MLFLILKVHFYFLTKTNYLNKEVSRTEPSPSLRPCLKRFENKMLCCKHSFYFGKLILMEQHALKNVNNCLKTNIYSYLETSSGQSFNLYLNVDHCFNTSVN
jgi:hypothetical protein